MYKLPIDNQCIGFISDASDEQLSNEIIEEIERLFEGKMVNGQRRTHRYGSKTLGSFGPFERNPLPPLFQSFLDQLVKKHDGVLNFDPLDETQSTSSITSNQPTVYNQVEILKLSPGTKHFFDIDREQKTSQAQLFITLQGTIPIALYNNKPLTHISTTITPDLHAIISPNQPKSSLSDQSTLTPDITSTTPETPSYPNKMTVGLQSILIVPPTNSCLLFGQEIVQNYTRQVKAASYKTKPMQLPLIPISPSATTSTVLKNAIFDYSLLYYTAKLKHVEKQQKRLEWLNQQKLDGKLTDEQIVELLRKDRLKDSSLEAEFHEEGVESPASNETELTLAKSTLATFQSTPEHLQAQEYLLSIPTHVYKRVNSYAIIFRSFNQFTPISDSLGEHDSGDENDKTTTDNSTSSSSCKKKLHISEKQNKLFAEKQARQSKAVPTLTINLEDMTENQLAEFEKKHVHSVYDNIADHFSGTRYQAWPQVDEFVQRLPANTLLADVGCGNGKYLAINSNILTIGCDISFNLLKLASQRGCNVAVGDSLAVPFRCDYFDNSISIAVLHHIASKRRRVECINELLRVTRPGGQILITVWAKEQDGSGGRVFNQGDVWVPFKTTLNVEQELQKQKEVREKELTEHHRINRKALLAPDQSSPQSQELQSSETTIQLDEKLPSTSLPDVQLPPDVAESSTRFYHVFSQGEIEDHVNDSAIKYPLRIDKVFYGKGNWCIIFTRL